MPFRIFFMEIVAAAHRIYIKYLQFDTLFFTFFKNGQFAMALRFVENYPLDKGGTPDMSEAGVCGKYLQTVLSP